MQQPESESSVFRSSGCFYFHNTIQKGRKRRACLSNAADAEAEDALFKNRMLVINSVILLCVILGTWMMLGGHEKKGGALSKRGVGALKYFTVLSNLFAGLTSFFLIVVTLLKKETHAACNLKYAAAVSVSLTFWVTACFLAPGFGPKWKKLYKGGNLYYHLIVPILCAVSVMFIEKPDISFGMTVMAVLPVIAYAAAYLIFNLSHMQNGRINPDYDWYGFFKGGIKSIPLVLTAIVGITWLIAMVLRWISGL